MSPDRQAKCKNCKQIPLAYFATAAATPHWDSYEALCSSALSCPMCVLIRNGFRRAFLDGQRERCWELQPRVDQAICEKIQLDSRGSNQSHEISVIRAGLAGENLRADIRGSRGLRCMMEVRPDTERKDWDQKYVVNLARSWISQSLVRESTHGHVPQSLPSTLSEKALPSRILDLSTSFATSRSILKRMLRRHGPKEQESPVQLICPGPGSKGEYVALSHRWGTTRHIVTTKATIESHCQQIQFTSLPKTFRDAVIVTRKLGYKYLWIDALCILQDDEDDWLRQSGAMAEIYHNAVCTIAAHTAEDDNQGFLSSVMKPESAKFSRTPLSLGLSLSLLGSFRVQVNKSPLSQRGWVFQERILSTRILHFVESRLFFEDRFGVRAHDRSLEGPDRHSPWVDGRISLQDVVDSTDDWYKLVERYSVCALTIDSDRLPAMAGLVSLVQGHRNDVEYCAGIWMDSLEQGLLWLSMDKPLQRPSYPTELLLPPSWSWAHWKGPVQYPKTIAGVKPCFTFLGITAGSMEQTTSPQRAQWRSTGSGQVLCLQTLLKPMTFLRHLPLVGVPQGLPRFLTSMSHTRLQRNALLSEHVSFPDTLLGLLPDWETEQESMWPYVGWISLDGDEATVGSRKDKIDLSKYSCVLIGSYRNRRVDYYDDDSSETVVLDLQYVLILEESHRDAQSGSVRYRRVGMGAFTRLDLFDDAVKKTVMIE